MGQDEGAKGRETIVDDIEYLEDLIRHERSVGLAHVEFEIERAERLVAALRIAHPPKADAEQQAREAVLQERSECISVVEAEPEPLGEMPDELWTRIANDRGAAGRVLLTAVQLAKRHIVDRIRARSTAQGA